MPRRLQTEPFNLPVGASFWHGFAPATLNRIDLAGALLLLGSCLMVSTALQQATASTSFASPEILPLLIVSGVLWIAFVVWQWYATTRLTAPEPVLPWRLFTNRMFLGMILCVYT